MENIIKEGYLNSLMRGVANSGSVQKRYYVLYGATPNSQARLDYYENETAFKTDPKCRKTIYLEEVKQMMRDTEAEEPNSFIIHMARGEKKTYHFAAYSELEMISWLRVIDQAQSEDKRLRSNSPFASLQENAPILVDQNAIYESAEEYQMFNVEIQETEAAKRCNLKIGSPYELYVLPENLCLIFKNHRIITWNYKHIRRYGCGDNNFTFEAGRKSLSGEGLFSFSVPNGSQLFRTVQEQMKHLQRQKHTGDEEFGRLLRSGPPSLPARNQSQSSDETSPRGSPTTAGAPPVPDRRSSGGSDTGPSHPQLPPKPKTQMKIAMPGKNKKNDKRPLAVEKPTHKPVLGSAVHNEFLSKIGAKPPMLKARGPPSPQSQAPPVSERTSSATPKGKITTEENRVSTGVHYELAKTKLPASERLPLANYTEASDRRVLEPNYIHGGSHEEHEYADYDITGSDRYRPNGSAAGAVGADPYYDDMTYSTAVYPNNASAWERQAAKDDGSAPAPMYDTPADAEACPSEMNDLIAQLVNIRSEPSSSEYDHICKFNVFNARPRRTAEDESTYNTYCLPEDLS